MKIAARLTLTAAVLVSLLAPAIPAAQRSDTRQRSPRSFVRKDSAKKQEPRVRVGRSLPGRVGKGDKAEDGGRVQKEPKGDKPPKVKERGDWPFGKGDRRPGKPDKGSGKPDKGSGKPDKGNGDRPEPDDSGDSGDDVRPGDDDGEQEPDKPTDSGSDRPRPDRPRPERPRPDRKPPRRPGGIIVDVGPVWPGRDDDRGKNDEDEEKDREESAEKDEDEEKEPEPDPSPLAPAEPAASANPAPARPLKYDNDSYRALIGSLLARNHIGAALKVLELLKEKEYFDYTGEYDYSTIASAAPAPEPAPAEYDRWAVGHATRVAKKKAKEDDWESLFEERADKVLALSREAQELEEAGPNRSAEDEERLAKLKEKLDAAARDLDVLVDGLSADLGKKDGRVKRLKASEDLMAELAHLGPGVVALYTIVTERRYWLVMVTPTERKAFSTPIAAADLNRKVDDLRRVLKSPKLDPVPLARELYGILVEPAARDLQAAGARTLMWSFDGVLRYVPVAALHDGQRYLLESYRHVVFTKASIARLREEPTRPWAGAGLGVARQVGDFRPLPAVADELRGIFGPDASAGDGGVVEGPVLLDERFTRQAMESTLRAEHSVVHIATHFHLQSGAADSLLLLGDGTLVNVDQIRKVKDAFRGVELLALSACDTAASRPGSDGKEVECFGTIAQRKGAAAVLASLWAVDDRSTSALMQAFYRLREAAPSTPKAEAMRQAQLQLLRGDLTVPRPAGAARALVHEEPGAPAAPAFKADSKAPFAHPYYWAPFVLIGNWK
jgi:CHAT domain-containing protein